MSTPPWMLVRIALETSIHQAPADEDRLGGLDVQTERDYRAMLVRIHGFEAPAEAGIAAVKGLDPELVKDRARIGKLQQDLRALGLPPEQIATLPRATVNIRSIPQALGWMFVLERHTLIAGLVRRHIARTLGEDAPLGYLTAYGETPGARFRAFGTSLSAQAHVHAPAAIVSAANEAFRAQRQWYHREQSRNVGVSVGVSVSDNEKVLA